MSIKVTSKVWDESPHTGTELLMLLAISDHANDQGRCWPSMATLAAKARVSERQANRLVRTLEASGAIRVTHRGSGKGDPTILMVNLDPASAVLRPPAETPAMGVTGVMGDIQGSMGVMGDTRTVSETVKVKTSVVRDSTTGPSALDKFLGARPQAPETIDQVMARAVAKRQQGGVDLSHYPPDVLAVLEHVASLFQVSPPRGGGPKAYWITQARQLQDACGEFGLDVVTLVHADWVAAHDRLTIEGPGSLVKLARAKAAELRTGLAKAAPGVLSDGVAPVPHLMAKLPESEAA